MIVLANGCSWTYGGGLDDTRTREELDQVTWPCQLAKLMNADKFYNLADGGGSNQRILRTTLDWLLKQDQHTLDNTVAFIQWTEESRYEYYSPLDFDDEYENIEERWMKVKLGNCIPLDLCDKYELSQDRIKYQNTKIQNIYTYINNCEAMANMLTGFNVKYYFWDFMDFPKYLPKLYKDYVLSKFNWLQYPKDYTCDFTPKEKLDPWRHWIYNRLQDDPHPSVFGHHQLACYIYDAWRKSNDAE